MNTLINQLEDLSLRLVRPEDAPEIFSLVDGSRVSLREFLPWLDHNKTVQDTEKFLESCVIAMENKKSFTFAIVYKESIAGIVSYHPIDWSNKIADLGYWISVYHRGKGLGRLAVSKILKHAFEELKLNRISIACANENKASQKIPESLNFKFEGVKRDAEWLYDHFVDHNIYSILRTEWLALSRC